MNEFELKFQVPDERLEAVAVAVRRGSPRRQRLQATYFDTPGEALAKASVVLRLRKEGSRWVQAAKGPGDNAFDRLEHEVAVAGRARPQPDVHRHAGTPIGKRLRAALEAEGASSLRAVFDTDVVRLTRSVEAGESMVEIAYDQGHVRSARRRHRVQEIEFERKQGSPLAVVELAQRWCEEHGLWLDPLSKSAMGWRLLRGESPPATGAARPAAKAKTPSAFVADLLATAWEQTLWNAREIAAEDAQAAHVHQMRVGLRRMRTVLRELGTLPALAGLDASVQEVLVGIFRVLGEHRDAGELVPALEQQVRQAGGPALEWKPVLPALGPAVRQVEVQLALLALLAHITALREQPATGEDLQGMREFVARRLDKLHRGVFKAGKHFAELPETARHDVRKRLKRLRYLGELARPLFAGRRVDKYVKGLRSLQDALGDYQDAATGCRLWTQRAGTEPAAWFGAGWLAAREAQLARVCEKACRQTARQAEPFWR